MKEAPKDKRIPRKLPQVTFTFTFGATFTLTSALAPTLALADLPQAVVQEHDHDDDVPSMGLELMLLAD